jgi:hypothetical protein
LSAQALFLEPAAARRAFFDGDTGNVFVLAVMTPPLHHRLGRAVEIGTPFEKLDAPDSVRLFLGHSIGFQVREPSFQALFSKFSASS